MLKLLAINILSENDSRHEKAKSRGEERCGSDDIAPLTTDRPD